MSRRRRRRARSRRPLDHSAAQAPARDARTDVRPGRHASRSSAQNVTCAKSWPSGRASAAATSSTADKLTGGPLACPCSIEHETQAKVLESLLRQAAGYVLTPQRAGSTSAVQLRDDLHPGDEHAGRRRVRRSARVDQRRDADADDRVRRTTRLPPVVPTAAPACRAGLPPPVPARRRRGEPANRAGARQAPASIVPIRDHPGRQRRSCPSSQSPPTGRRGTDARRTPAPAESPVPTASAGDQTAAAAPAAYRVAYNPGMTPPSSVSRTGEYAERGDYHRELSPDWEFYPTYLAKMDARARVPVGAAAPTRACSTPDAARACSSRSSTTGCDIEGLDPNYSSEHVTRDR